ncbi:hypothetical protein DdX_13624 [Ditylenchus destructor]|uniref:Uncharacterized protein n=1 Tax=Ditylenchus destructor TaxID=166010 RepID=A0AAD4MYM5_9BILA|nr:hypothetical protein DdX_13624 [Ditylenchus destructor]
MSFRKVVKIIGVGIIKHSQGSPRSFHSFYDVCFGVRFLLLLISSSHDDFMVSAWLRTPRGFGLWDKWKCKLKFRADSEICPFEPSQLDHGQNITFNCVHSTLYVTVHI